MTSARPSARTFLYIACARAPARSVVGNSAITLPRLLGDRRRGRAVAIIVAGEENCLSRARGWAAMKWIRDQVARPASVRIASCCSSLLLHHRIGVYDDCPKSFMASLVYDAAVPAVIHQRLLSPARAAPVFKQWQRGVVMRQFTAYASGARRAVGLRSVMFQWR